MKDGEVVEQAPVERVLNQPQQAYTRRLLAAIPRGYQPGSPMPAP
jgi:peptide/nickel transport system ATP-binding protein